MTTKVIDNISFPKLSNPYHVSFLSYVKAGIDKYGAENMGISEVLYGKFTEQLEAEQDIVNRARSSQYTQPLSRYDQTRDNYFRRIFYKLKNAENDSENSAITPELVATIQEYFLKQYPLSITTEANQKETAKLRGLIKDLRQFIPEHLSTLEIANDIAILEEANDNYEKTYVLRASEIASSADTSECRQASEQIYVVLTLHIATIANSLSDNPLDVAKAETCGKCIDDINQLVKDFKRKAYRKNDNDNVDDNDNDNVDDNVE